MLQSALLCVNTLLLQEFLAESAWAKKLADEDRRGLTALFWSNINPYGTFRLERTSASTWDCRPLGVPLARSDRGTVASGDL